MSKTDCNLGTLVCSLDYLYEFAMHRIGKYIWTQAFQPHLGALVCSLDYPYEFAMHRIGKSIWTQAFQPQNKINLTHSPKLQST